MSIERNKAVVRRFLDEVISQGNLTVADEILAPNLRMYPPGSQEPLDREAFKRFLKGWRDGFPDMYDTIEDLLAEEDKVVVRVTIRGTHEGEFQGMAPTGKKVMFAGFAIYRLAGGKILEFQALNDRWSLM